MRLVKFDYKNDKTPLKLINSLFDFKNREARRYPVRAAPFHIWIFARTEIIDSNFP